MESAAQAISVSEMGRGQPESDRAETRLDDINHRILDLNGRLRMAAERFESALERMLGEGQATPESVSRPQAAGVISSISAAVDETLDMIERLERSGEQIDQIG